MGIIYETHGKMREGRRRKNGKRKEEERRKKEEKKEEEEKGEKEKKEEEKIRVEGREREKTKKKSERIKGKERREKKKRDGWGIRGSKEKLLLDFLCHIHTGLFIMERVLSFTDFYATPIITILQPKTFSNQSTSYS